MTDTINAVIAGIVLAGLVMQLAHAAPQHAEWWSTTIRHASKALIGAGLLAFVLAPFTGQLHDGAQTALLIGLAVLLLARWRRKTENGK